MVFDWLARLYGYSERQACNCKLMGMDRTSYRHQPRPDHNAVLRQGLIALARQYSRASSTVECLLRATSRPVKVRIFLSWF